MTVSRFLSAVTVAGTASLAFLGAWSTPALADHLTTRCDADGDRCWRVWCDSDWDRCHPISGSGFRRHTGYYRHYYRPYAHAYWGHPAYGYAYDGGWRHYDYGGDRWRHHEEEEEEGDE